MKRRLTEEDRAALAAIVGPERALFGASISEDYAHDEMERVRSFPEALLRADSPGDLLSTLKKYVRAHLGGDLSLSALAGILHVNASYLSRLFSRGCGQTLTEYVTDERMRAACALLRDTQWQIQEIAARVGFDSASYFTNVFRRRLGISPQKYREDARGGRRR